MIAPLRSARRTTSRSARWIVAAVLTAATALALAACSDDSGDSEDTGAASSGAATNGSDQAPFPVSVDSALGTATIDEQPERVITLGWGSQDIALALGVTPVALQDMSGDTDDDSGILPWDRDFIDGEPPELLSSASDDIPFEKIADLEPDVILAVNSGLTQEQYDKLSGVAPTVAYPEKPWKTSWQDQTTLVGEALGKGAEAQQLVDDTNDLIDSAKAEHPEFSGKTISFTGAVKPDGLNQYLSTDSRVTLLEQLGFAIAPVIPDTADSFAVPVGLENLGTIDSDVLVSWFLTDEVKDELESAPTFATIPAVARGGYVPLTDSAMVYATSAVSVLSLPWMLDRYLPLLSDAANGDAPLA